MKFSYFMPTRIFFGEGSVKKLAKARIKGPEGPVKKALLVTGGTSTTKLGYVGKVRDALREGGVDCVVYDRAQPNPTLAGVRECAEIIRREGCDLVVGLGGGSSIDTAKAAAVAAANPGDFWDYVAAGTGGGKKPGGALPIVAVTTTAGTGTEADPWTVVTDEQTHEKIGSGWDCTFPTLSIVDPDFMVSVPPFLTACQGFDALFHACEGYIATIANPVSDMFALKSIEYIGKSLEKAVKDGQDKQARADVALANTFAGFVESMSSCTSEHAMEHALSAFHPKLPHGAGLIMLSRAYFTAFAPACAERFVDMARALGRKDAKEPMDFVERLVELQEGCGVADLKLSEYGVDGENMEKYVKNARETMGNLFKLDAKALTDEEILKIYKDSYR